MSRLLTVVRATRRDILKAASLSAAVTAAIDAFTDEELERLVWFVYEDGEFGGVEFSDGDRGYKPVDLKKQQALDIIEQAVREEVARSAEKTRAYVERQMNRFTPGRRNS